jgi:hypothetical protein
MASLNETSPDRLPDALRERLGEPTSTLEGEGSHVHTWEELGGETVIFARNVRGWEAVAMQVEAELENCRPAAVIAATGSGIQPFHQRIDLLELLRVCKNPRVRRLALADATRIARDPNVLFEVFVQLSELGVSVERADRRLHWRR